VVRFVALRCLGRDRSHARNGNELERPSSRARVDLFLFSSSLLAIDNKNDLQARDARRPTRPNHSPSPSHRFSFTFPPLDLRSRITPNRQKPLQYHATAVRSFLYLGLAFPFMRLHLFYLFPHHRNPRGRSPLRYTTWTQLTDNAPALLLVEEGIVHRSFSLSFLLSTYPRASPSRRSSSERTAVHAISADPSRACSSQSTPAYLSLLSFSLLVHFCSWMTLPPSQHLA
jgi:hypothetical protein